MAGLGYKVELFSDNGPVNAIPIAKGALSVKKGGKLCIDSAILGSKWLPGVGFVMGSTLSGEGKASNIMVVLKLANKLASIQKQAQEHAANVQMTQDVYSLMKVTHMCLVNDFSVYNGNYAILQDPNGNKMPGLQSYFYITRRRHLSQKLKLDFCWPAPRRNTSTPRRELGCFGSVFLPFCLRVDAKVLRVGVGLMQFWRVGATSMTYIRKSQSLDSGKSGPREVQTALQSWASSGPGFKSGDSLTP
ncbi:hypothetical protein TSUD_412930 [Trifolium subterraneum]|uniref:Uncharacterized protein n=1 Tax=Trifolium subterraneum TaxID=3900 RepID=A0A2Z6PKM8_TRISU|nr:hypothetical protein TSUD_412930 [Trifolium subterraneum]